MDKICSTAHCLGCFACMNVCPKNAISVTEDRLGKTIPTINTEKCVNCSLCRGVCPVINLSEFHKTSKCYAAYTKNEKDRRECSSGGAASAFVRKIYEENGVASGVVFENGIAVQKLMTASDDWEKMKGSRYVQSFTGTSYRDIKNALTNGKKAVYIGTPCQIAGLNCFLKKEYENLVTVDLICHGTPPMKYLCEYVQDRCGEYTDVSFRGKKDYYLSVYNNSIVYRKKDVLDNYFTAFSDGLICRDNCYNCPYARQERVSDITIGDFWGVDWSTLKMPIPDKLSVVLVNTDKGQLFWDSVKEKMYYEERQVEEAVNGNSQLRTPSTIHTNRKLFEEVYLSAGFVTAVKRANISPKKSAVIKSYLKNTKLWKFVRKIKYRVK